MSDIKMRHPDAKSQISVREDLASEYEANGWAKVGAKSEDDKK